MSSNVSESSVNCAAAMSSLSCGIEVAPMIDAPRNQRLATYPSASCTSVRPRHLASLDEGGHAQHLFCNGRAGFFLRWIEFGAAEHRHVALRPVNLVEVNVVGLQAFEAGIHCFRDHVLREVGATGTNPVAPARTG